MREIVIASGKGGAGKTGLCAVLCALSGEDAVYVDADVDAANLGILMDAKQNESHEFFSGKEAGINPEICQKCGVCVDVCRFGAIKYLDDEYIIDDLSCEGCGSCLDECGFGAIELKDNYCGDWFISDTKFGGKLVHAYLGIGEDNSGKLVAEIKRIAKDLADSNKLEYILIDSPPGIGCPTISSLSGADLVVIVAESSASGIHDSLRLLQLANQFKINTVCVMNKVGLNLSVENKFEKFLKDNEVPLIGMIPFTEEFMTLLNEKKHGLKRAISS